MYVQSDALLLSNVLENFRNNCMEIYELDPAWLLSAPGLAWQVCLKKIGITLLLLICHWWLKKELEVKYDMQYIGLQKLIINILNIMIKIKNHHSSCI